MMPKVFIDGAVGTTGLEIAERMAGRSDFRVISLSDADRKNVAARAAIIRDSDFVILCLPDDAAREAVAFGEGAPTRFIDCSTAHRVADGWVYGFAEFSAGQRDAIRTAARVSNPGCYSTGFIALVAPLVEQGLLPSDHGFIVNAVSGYSGGGKDLIARMQNDAPEIGYRAYALGLEHKHLPEMQVRCGLSRSPLFSPAVVRAFRGMLVDVPLFLDPELGFADARTLHEALADHYADEPLVSVAPAGTAPAELLVSEGDAASDCLKLYVLPSADGSQARLIAMLDNLGKGASGAAVQNLNIMAGLDEQAGLRV
ncbi:MAG: N-acetyl-gamma-glutamyl-phosphate reductase [Blastomonas sp.]